MHAFTDRFALAGFFAAIVAAAACTQDNPIVPPDGVLGVRAILAAAVTDTIDAPVPQVLTAEVRGRDGRLARGIIIRFEAQVATNVARVGELATYVCPRTTSLCAPSSAVAIDTTDVDGRVEASVRLGRVSGATYVRIRAPELGVADSVRLTVTPGAAVGVRTDIKDTLINIGNSITVKASVIDRYGNARSDAVLLTAGPENAFTLDAATGRVTALDLGTQYVYGRSGTFVDSTRVRMLPGGVLVVWNSREGTLQLMNLGRSNIRTLAAVLVADNGAFPRFDATGQRITTLISQFTGGGSDDAIMITDTTGARVGYLSPADGFESVMSSRQMADGSLLVVGRLVLSPATYSMYRVSTTGVITKAIEIPGLARVMAGADISHDGNRIAYLVPNGTMLELRTLNVTTGGITVLDPDARAPRWSHGNDRVAFTIGSFSLDNHDGAIAIINADGTGRRTFGDIEFRPGFAWSPDDRFVIGGNPQTGTYFTTRLLRVRDGYSTLFAYLSKFDVLLNYSHFDWQ